MLDPEIIEGRWQQFGDPEKWLGPELVNSDDGFAYGEVDVQGYSGEDSEWHSLTVWVGVIDGVPIEWPNLLRCVGKSRYGHTDRYEYVTTDLPPHWQKWLEHAREKAIFDYIDNYEPPDPEYDDGPWLSEQVERADRIQRELK